MLRRNPPRQASREDRRMSYNQAFLSSPPSSTSKAKTSSPSMNRKRIRDEPSTQQAAKRQSNVPTTIDSQISPAIVAGSSQGLQQPQVIQPVVSPDSLDEDAAKITRRIGDYKSRLQNLEAEHKALSQDRDPETVSGMKKTLGDTTARRKKTATELHKIKDVIKQMAKTINDYRDVVPSQLHQALKASRTDRDSFEIKLRKIGDLETKQIQQLKDAERKYDEAGAKLEDLDKQMNKCKLNLRSTEKDLNNVLLQRRLGDLSRINVSALPYDQRFHLAKLAEQMTAVLEGGSETYTA